MRQARGFFYPQAEIRPDQGSNPQPAGCRRTAVTNWSDILWLSKLLKEVMSLLNWSSKFSLKYQENIIKEWNTMQPSKYHESISSRFVLILEKNDMMG